MIARMMNYDFKNGFKWGEIALIQNKGVEIDRFRSKVVEFNHFKRFEIDAFKIEKYEQTSKKNRGRTENNFHYKP